MLIILTLTCDSLFTRSVTEAIYQTAAMIEVINQICHSLTHNHLISEDCEKGLQKSIWLNEVPESAPGLWL